jgi:pimeloyl-ACP methyl ester carboxylesterase
MTIKHVYMLLGGMFGPDGVVLAPIENSGMIVMQAQLKNMGCDIRVETWDNWMRFLSMIGPESAGDKNILIGYSGGGTRATWLASKDVHGHTKPHIDLMILIDPSPSYQMHAVGKNVKHVLLIHNNFPGIYGGGDLVINDHTPPVHRIDVSAPHLMVPELPQVQEAVLSAVREL